MRNCAEFAFSLTVILLAISLTISSPDGLAQTQMVLVATGSTMPEPLYVLWGDEYHKLHAETQVRYLAVGTSESANRVLSGTGGDLGGGDAPIPEKQLKKAAHAAVELPTVLVGIAVFYNVPGNATSIRLSGLWAEERAVRRGGVLTARAVVPPIRRQVTVVRVDVRNLKVPLHSSEINLPATSQNLAVSRTRLALLKTPILAELETVNSHVSAESNNSLH